MKGVRFMRKKNLLIFSLILMFALGSCHLYKLERRLDAEDKEFLSKVHYIISKGEKKIYLEMPKEDRGDFKKEFWKRRDTDPDTEGNQFKTLYFERIKEANRLFTSGREGWLTDRGRIFILLGPPINKSLYPFGDSTVPYSRPQEIWHYPDFPVIFVDYQGTGDYQCYYLSLSHQAWINDALLDAKEPYLQKEGIFDYDLKIKRIDNKYFLIVEINKQYLWMKEKEKGEGLVTILQIEIEIFDMSHQELWKHKENYQVTNPENALSQEALSKEIIEIELDLPPGTYVLNSKIKNLTDEQQRNKSKVIKLE